MNLLFLTPAPPFPPDQGTAIRNWGLISSLSEQHQISLLTFAKHTDQIARELRDCCSTVSIAITPTRTHIQRLATVLGSSRADITERLSSLEFAKRLQELLAFETYDAVQVEGLELAPYLKQIAKQRGAATTPLIIFDAHNAETVIQHRAFHTDRTQVRSWLAALYSRLQFTRLARLEHQTCTQADTVLCVSEADCDTLRQLVPGLEPVLIPNGIFLHDYPTTVKVSEMTTPALVFTGKMDYRPNVDAVLWFAQKILPRVHETHTEARLIIVGKSPTESVRRLAKHPSITVTGPVPDVRPLIAAATVIISPLRMGGGTRFKLLEAMALMRPIVSTTIGAEGFPVTSGRELLIADSPREMATAICHLLDNPQARSRLGEAGRAFVESEHQWSTIIPKLRDVYNRIGI